MQDAEDLGRMEDADESGRDVTFILRGHVRFVELGGTGLLTGEDRKSRSGFMVVSSLFALRILVIVLRDGQVKCLRYARYA